MRICTVFRLDGLTNRLCEIQYIHEDTSRTPGIAAIGLRANARLADRAHWRTDRAVATVVGTGTGIVSSYEPLRSDRTRSARLIPGAAPVAAGSALGTDPGQAITALMDDCGGRYQICGPNAFNRYGFDDQIPNRLYAYNNRISGDRKIGQVEMTLIKVDDERLGATETTTVPEGPTLVYSSRARALVDAVYDWSRFDGIPAAIDGFGTNWQRSGSSLQYWRN